MQATIRLRRNNSAEWTSLNPVLDAGEQGYETDTGHYKIGDGFRKWLELDYYLPSAEMRDEIDSAVRQAIDALPAGALSAYVHVQTAPAATWIVQHDLGHIPFGVTVVVGGEVVETDTHVDDSVVTLTFAAPTSGLASVL